MFADSACGGSNFLYSVFNKTVAAPERSDGVVLLGPRFRFQLKRGYRKI